MREKMSENEPRRKTQRIAERFLQQDELLNAQNILIYASNNKGEVYTRRIIDMLIGMGKVVSLPRTNKIKNRFVRGAFLDWEKTVETEEGYIESTVAVDENFDDIDLIVVPAVAVSLSGKRIGYGNPYYVNLISRTLAPRVILAFEFQLFPEIESTEDDFVVDKIITERRVINVKNKLRF
jgi:5-formyltetrahydrofolate cyclo-ligase